MSTFFDRLDSMPPKTLKRLHQESRACRVQTRQQILEIVEREVGVRPCRCPPRKLANHAAPSGQYPAGRNTRLLRSRAFLRQGRPPDDAFTGSRLPRSRRRLQVLRNGRTVAARTTGATASGAACRLGRRADHDRPLPRRSGAICRRRYGRAPFPGRLQFRDPLLGERVQGKPCLLTTTSSWPSLRVKPEGNKTTQEARRRSSSESLVQASEPRVNIPPADFSANRVITSLRARVSALQPSSRSCLKRYWSRLHR